MNGFEPQLGTNYLAHFALTTQLMLPRRNGNDARVVTLSSIAARDGRINFDDLQAERHYKPLPVYSQSKLACLMFAFELQRRSAAGGWGVTSIAAHPGILRTTHPVAGVCRALPAAVRGSSGLGILKARSDPHEARDMKLYSIHSLHNRW